MAEVEFRTGIREVPDHLAKLMGGLETWNMTFEEAVQKANWKLANDFANRAQEAHIRKTLGR